MVTSVFRAALLSMAACGLALSAVSASAQTPAPVATEAPAAQAPAAEPKPENPVVARVNGEEIRRSDVQEMVTQLPPQVQQMPLEMIFPAVVEQLVSSKLVSAAGYKAGFANSDEVKAEIKRAEERAVQRLYLDQEIEKALTEDALSAAYKTYLEQNPAQEEVKAAQILVEKEDEAKAIIKQLQKGGDFAKLAKEKSKDKAAAEQGGDLGYFTKSMMVEPFAEAAFGMKKGEVSKTPVKTDFGWHIIKLEDRRTQEPAKLDEVKPQLEQQISRDVINKMLETLRAEATVETFQIDGSPMPTEAPAEAAPADKPAEAPAKP